MAFECIHRKRGHIVFIKSSEAIIPYIYWVFEDMNYLFPTLNEWTSFFLFVLFQCLWFIPKIWWLQWQLIITVQFISPNHFKWDTIETNAVLALQLNELNNSQTHSLTAERIPCHSGHLTNTCFFQSNHQITSNPKHNSRRAMDIWIDKC